MREDRHRLRPLRKVRKRTLLSYHRSLAMTMRCVRILLTSVALGGAVRAGSIAVDFTGNHSAVLVTNDATVARGANWNSDGAAGLIFLSFPAGDAPTNTLSDTNLYGNETASEAPIALANIPHASYDVYASARRDEPQDTTLFDSDGITVFYRWKRAQDNFDGGWLPLTTSSHP